jgi:DNA-binding beta-propeller fold protein YncE
MQWCEVSMRYNSAVLLAIALWVGPVSYGQQSKALVLAQTISFPDVQGGFNHMSVDAWRLRLFAAMPTNTTMEAANLKAGEPWRSLKGERPAAVRYAPEFDQLYVARGQGVSIYDGESLDLLESVDLGSGVDELQYDAQAKRLYVGCMTAGKTGVAVIALPEGELLGTIALPDKPQGIAVERSGTRIFANMPTLKQVAVMDRDKRVLVTAWPLADAEGNAPLGLDEARHRLFVGTRRPAQVVVLDTATGNAVAKIDINSDTDDLFYDAAHRRIYVSCGEGFVDVIEQRDADHYRLVARVATVAGARTSTFSPELNILYVGVPRRGEQPAEVRVYKVGK